jgi:hypothetical protein
MMRFKQGALDLLDPSLRLPALILCLSVSLWPKAASGGFAAHPTGALALQGQGPTQQLTSPASDGAHGLINLDVVVTDNSGKTITGLGPNDFTLLDNHQAQKILSFDSFDGVSAKPDPPVEVILVIDTMGMPGYLSMGMPGYLAGFEREEVERFLRQNGGHLAQPFTIFGLSDKGFWTLAEPSNDGNALAAEIAGDRLAFIRRWNPLESIVVREPDGLKALKALGHIAAAERRKPGKKLLFWVDPVGVLGAHATLRLGILSRAPSTQSIGSPTCSAKLAFLYSVFQWGKPRASTLRRAPILRRARNVTCSSLTEWNRLSKRASRIWIGKF